jgi:hypothetical protein
VFKAVGKTPPQYPPEDETENPQAGHEAAQSTHGPKKPGFDVGRKIGSGGLEADRHRVGQK